MSLDSGSAHLNGEVRATVHYFEEGNVQLGTKWAYSTSVSYSVCRPVTSMMWSVFSVLFITHLKVVALTVVQDADSLAKAVTSAISTAEITYHKTLDETYGALSENFKVLRRALPITKQPMNWSALGAYKVGSDIGGKR